MAQSGWRLPPELLKRVRVRAAEEGVRQNAWVERALESALGGANELPPGDAMWEWSERDGVVAAPTRKPKPAPKLPAGVKTAREIASERQAALNKAKGS